MITPPTLPSPHSASSPSRHPQAYSPSGGAALVTVSAPRLESITVGLEDTVIQQGIARDVAYVGNLARDLNAPRSESFYGTLAFCIVPYLSLVIHESYRKLERSDPALATSLSDDVKAIVARSRHSLKLFEDAHRGVEGQLAYFRDEVLPAHASRFLGNTWLPIARPLETDLGLFSYDHKLIASTHGANFHMGVEPQALLAKTGAEVRAIYEECGRYFGRLGARLDTDEGTFVSHLDPLHFDQRPNDVRANTYYRSVFDGPNNPDLNALLTVFRGMINFVDSVITAGMDKRLFEYTVFKIRFLTLYQILGSLRLVRDEQLRTLSSRSVAFIDTIERTVEAQLIMDPAAKPFRNTLMHYNLDPRVDATRVDINDVLFGLVPIYFPSHSPATFMAIVDRCIAQMAVTIEEWATGAQARRRWL